MNLTPAFSPQLDGFVAAALFIFAVGCALSFLPSVVTGVLCARAIHSLNSCLATMLGVAMGIAAYATCLLLSTLGIFFGAYLDDETLIFWNIMVSVIVGAAGAVATWRICRAWNRRRQDRR